MGGFEGPLFCSLIENGSKTGPNDADDVPAQGARARARASYRSIISTVGTHFGIVGTRGLKAQEKLSKYQGGTAGQCCLA